FTKTLAASKSRPLYYNHRISIGTVQLTDTPAGLGAKGKLSLDLQDGKDAYTRLRDGIIKSMSIGYQAIQQDLKDGIRYVTEIKLYEVSLVEMPANPEAVITAVKQRANRNENYIDGDAIAMMLIKEYTGMLRKAAGKDF